MVCPYLKNKGSAVRFCLWPLINIEVLPFHKHDNEKVLVDCDVCSIRFLLYQDRVPTCTNCLTDMTIRKNRSKQGTPIAFLFELFLKA